MSHLRIDLVQMGDSFWHLEIFVNGDGPYEDGQKYDSREAAQVACDAMMNRLQDFPYTDAI
jgi:hypothetical protein